MFRYLNFLIDDVRTIKRAKALSSSKSRDVAKLPKSKSKPIVVRQCCVAKCSNYDQNLHILLTTFSSLKSYCSCVCSLNLHPWYYSDYCMNHSKCWAHPSSYVYSCT